MEREQKKEVMLAISMGLLLLYFIFDLKGLLIASFCVGLVGVFSSWLSGRIAWGWYQLARGISYIMNNILLSLVFFLVLTPLAFLYKILNKHSYPLSNKEDSYFINRRTTFSKDSFEKLW